MRRLTGFREPDVRRVFGAVLLSKMVGVVAILGAMKGFAFFLDSPAGASTGVAGQSAADLVNPINTMWVLVAAFLVFFMQAGFMVLEAGLRPLARDRQHPDGVHLRHLPVRPPVLGLRLRLHVRRRQRLHRAPVLLPARTTPPTLRRPTGVAFLAFFLFQFAFADTASTITSGAMVGRTGFKGDILYSVGVSGFIYPIFGHWVWGPGGWLATRWAGSTASSATASCSVTSPARPSCTPSAACIALAGAIALGPRLGRKFKRDGGGPMPPPRPHHRRHRRRDPVVRLVRLQPRLHAVGAWTSRASAASPPTPRWPPAPAAWSPCSSSIPDRRSGTWACRSTASSPAWSPSPARATGCHRSARSSSARSPASSSCSASTCSSTCASTTRSARSPVHGVCGIWGTLSRRPVRHRPVRHPDPTAPTTASPIEGLFYGGGTDQLLAQAHRQPHLRRRRVGSWRSL